MDNGLHDSLGRFGGKDGGRGLRSLMCMGMIMETTGRRERDVTATSSASGGRVQSGTVTGSANDYGARGRTTPDPRSVSYLVSFPSSRSPLRSQQHRPIIFRKHIKLSPSFPPVTVSPTTTAKIKANCRAGRNTNEGEREGACIVTEGYSRLTVGGHQLGVVTSLVNNRSTVCRE